MTFSNGGSQTFHSDASSGTTLTFVPGVTIPAGSTITIGWAAPGSVQTSACADNSVQAGTANAYTRRTAVTSGATLKGGLVHCTKTTRAILAANTITLTLNASVTRRTGVMQWWLPSNSNPVIGANTSQNNGDTTSPVALPALTPDNLHSLVVVGQFWWNGASTGVSGAGSANPSATLGVHSSGPSTAIEVTMCTTPDINSVAAFTPTLSYTTITNGCADAINFTDIASGTLFTKSLTGSMGFSSTAARPKIVMQRKQPLAVFAPTGAITSHPTARRVTATFTPTGTITRQLALARTLTATLNFSGAVTSATARLRTLVGATFHPTGVFSSIKSVSKSVSGALSFSGSQTRLPAKVITGSFQPTGSISKQSTLTRTLTGSLSFAGALNRLTSRRLTGAAQFVGMVITSAKTSQFFASFRPTGTVTHGLPARTLFASLALTGSIARFTSRNLFASLVASGVIHTQYLPPVPPSQPGGGGFGALMSDAHFQRYRVASAWRGVKRVKP